MMATHPAISPGDPDRASAGLEYVHLKDTLPVTLDPIAQALQGSGGPQSDCSLTGQDHSADG